MSFNTICVKLLISCAFSLALPTLAHSQVNLIAKKNVIQFSGIAVDADSLTPLPYVAIIIRNKERGVYSNENGYYSFVVEPNDTLDFYALGYHRAGFIISDTISTNHYTHVQALRIDTILLQVAVIYPWPSKEQFKNAFLNSDIPGDNLERARYNLAQAQMIRVAQSVAMDAGMIYRSSMQQQTNKNYYAGQKPPNNLLNPIAWAQFLKAIRNGELKGN